MKISVIIPAYNEERLLPGTLREVKAAMKAFERRGWETELIVCDNNSTDRTAEIGRAAGARVVFEAVNQIGRARNRGAAEASGDWLLFIDADSHPSAELLEDVAEEIKAGRCLAGGCTVKMDGDSGMARMGTALWNWLSRTWRLLAGSFIFCETRAFRQVGGFSNELYAAEELDLTKRLRKLSKASGKQIVILNRHPLLTSARKMELYSTGELVRLLMRVGLSRGQVLRNREACHAWYDGRR